MWDLIVSVPDHCLSFYFVPLLTGFQIKIYEKYRRKVGFWEQEIRKKIQ